MEERILNSVIGVTGTVFSFSVANAESAAAIFAGLATGLYMTVAGVIQVKRWRAGR